MGQSLISCSPGPQEQNCSVVKDSPFVEPSTAQMVQGSLLRKVSVASSGASLLRHSFLKIECLRRVTDCSMFVDSQFFCCSVNFE